MLFNASSVFGLWMALPLPKHSRQLSAGHNIMPTPAQDTESSDFDRRCLTTLTDWDLALRDAAIQGNIKIFLALLKNGANNAALDIPRVIVSLLKLMALDINGYAVVNTSSFDTIPQTALQVVMLVKNHTMIEILLAARANINVLDTNSHTALHTALNKQDHRLVRLLLDKGAMLMILM
jgi:hypothetical protein